MNKQANRIYKKLYENENTNISATLEDGKLTICHCSWGETTEEHYGDFDVEYFVNFDIENTIKFKQAVEKLKDEPFMNRLIQLFSTSSAHSRIQEFCIEHQIEFKNNIY